MTTRAPLHCRTFIDNDFRPGQGGLERRNPANDELVAVADVADAATVDAAVGAARAAFATWGTTTGFERGQLLRELARVALDRLDDLATSMTLEMGKPLDEARGEVRKFAQAMRFYAEEAERIGGETIPNESNDFLSVVRKDPVGPVAAITPWNYPVELIGWKLGGALGAGCTVVVKPSEYSPGAAQLLAECIREAGFPPGVVNVVHGAGEVGGLLAAHPAITKIAFTGSIATGQRLFKTVSGVTRLTLELGGSCPMLVSRHADLDLAAAGAVRRSFRNAGQICIAINRIYVERPVLGDFVDRVAELTRGLTVADGYENPGADVGPVTMEEIRARTTAHVADARERGATVVAGAEPHADGGLFLNPAVVLDAPLRREDHDRRDVRAGRRRHARRLAGRRGAARQRRPRRPRRLPVHRGARRDDAAQQRAGLRQRRRQQRRRRDHQRAVRRPPRVGVRLGARSRGAGGVSPAQARPHPPHALTEEELAHADRYRPGHVDLQDHRRRS